MTDSVILRVPTGPQYSYFELKLEFESYDQLNIKIDALHNGLLAKLSAAVSTACELARLEPSAMAQIEAWEGLHGSSVATPGEARIKQVAEMATLRTAPSEADSDDMDPTCKTEADVVKRELGATMLAQYKTVAPWDEAPAVDTRPAPPWAAPASPTPVVSGGLNLDDF